MDSRTEFLSTNLRGYLERKGVPLNLQGKIEAQKGEIKVLNRTVLKYAPHQNIADWWAMFEISLEENQKTRGWPSVNEIYKAATAVTPFSGVRPAQGNELDTVKIHARRMNEGEAVGDGWFYGRQAVELLEARLVSEQTMKKYRSAWFFAAKDVWGEEAARREENKLVQRHECARDLVKSEKKFSAPPVNVKKIPTYEWDGAA